MKARAFLTILVFGLLVGLIGLISSFSQNSVCANSVSCIKNLGVQIDNSDPGVFAGRRIYPPKINLTAADFRPTVLADQSGTGEKHIYVDLAKQTLSAYQGDQLFMQTLISSGKWFPTPTGDFKIWVKLRATRMTGGQGADFYDLPNVPYVMFFAGGDVSQGRGFSLHGTYWHNNFGHPMSHGCVNMRTTDAEKLYNWVNPTTTSYTSYASSNDPGTKVTIYGQAPL